VLVPINFRLTGDDWAFIVEHSGARVVLAHSDQLDTIDAAREGMPGVEHSCALEGAYHSWLDSEALLAQAPPTFTTAVTNAPREFGALLSAVALRVAAVWPRRCRPRRLGDTAA
jgi:hypothetical protein